MYNFIIIMFYFLFKIKTIKSVCFIYCIIKKKRERKEKDLDIIIIIIAIEY